MFKWFKEILYPDLPKPDMSRKAYGLPDKEERNFNDLLKRFDCK